MLYTLAVLLFNISYFLFFYTDMYEAPAHTAVCARLGIQERTGLAQD